MAASSYYYVDIDRLKFKAIGSKVRDIIVVVKNMFTFLLIIIIYVSTCGIHLYQEGKEYEDWRGQLTAIIVSFWEWYSDAENCFASSLACKWVMDFFSSFTNKR